MRPALRIQRGHIELIAADEGTFVRLRFLARLTADEIAAVRLLSPAGRRRLRRTIEGLCSDGRTTGSVSEERGEGEPIIVGLLIEQRLIDSAGSVGLKQRAVDGAAKIAVIARRVAAALATITDAHHGGPPPSGVLGADPMVG